MGEKPDRQKVDQHVSSESPTSFVRQLSDRVLSSNAVALVKELSYRAIPTRQLTPTPLQTVTADSPPGSDKNETNAVLDAKKAAPPPRLPPTPAARGGVELCASVCGLFFLLVLASGFFLGWVPLLVMGVIYFVDTHSFSAAATAISNATLILNTTGSGSGVGGGGSSFNAVGMIVGGSIWGFVICWSMLVGAL